ncbi:MAG TPA: hypothetical protein VG077_10640 [Verrucomicrobiae bacterium]|nr:hypothetical protein [Verrucomicrobiae bacterium]
MIPDEFQQLIEEQTDTQLLGSCLYEDMVPYVFEPKPEAWDTFRYLLVSSFNVGRADIRVVGSGRLGFSLKPGKKLIKLAEDIDEQLEDPSADTSEPSKKYARAIEKASNDKARRADRHETLCGIIKPFLKVKK